MQEFVLTIKAKVPGHGVEVTGPLQDKRLCYAMLEEARDVILAFSVQNPPNQIQPARFVPQFPNGGHG